MTEGSNATLLGGQRQSWSPQSHNPIIHRSGSWTHNFERDARHRRVLRHMCCHQPTSSSSASAREYSQSRQMPLKTEPLPLSWMINKKVIWSPRSYNTERRSSGNSSNLPRTDNNCRKPTEIKNSWGRGHRVYIAASKVCYQLSAGSWIYTSYSHLMRDGGSADKQAANRWMQDRDGRDALIVKLYSHDLAISFGE